MNGAEDAKKSPDGPKAEMLLTPRELEVLRSCADGLSDAEIGALLGISVFTVGNHIARILHKTVSVNRTQAVAWAFTHGVLSGGGIPGPGPEERLGGAKLSSASNAAATLAVSNQPQWEIPALSVLPQARRSESDGPGPRAMALAGELEHALRRPEHWQGALEKLGRAFDSHIPMIIWTNLPHENGITVTEAPAMGADWRRRFEKHYAPINPLLPLIMNAPADFFAFTEDRDFGTGFCEHPFYREYCRALDIEKAAVWTVFPDRRWCAELFLSRPASAPAASAPLRELGVLLFPYVRHALTELWRRAAAQEALECSPAALPPGEDPWTEKSEVGMLLLDRHGRTIAANPPADAVLTGGQWLLSSPTGLRAAYQTETEKLRAAIHRAALAAAGRGYAAPQTVVLHPRDGHKRSLRVSILPRLATEDRGPVPIRRGRVVLTFSTGARPVADR